MNSNFSYLTSKCSNLTSKNQLKSCNCLSVSLSVQYLIQSHNWIDFGHFFHFFCKFLTRYIKKIMTTCKIIFTPTNKEQKFLMLWPQLLRSISNCVIKLLRFAVYSLLLRVYSQQLSVNSLQFTL